MAKLANLQKAAPGFARMLRHFGPDLATQRLPVLGAMVALFAGVAMQLLEPWPLKFIVDGLVASAGGEGAPGFQQYLIYAAIGYVLIVALRATAEFHESIGFAKIGNRVVSRIRTRLYRRVQALPLSFHQKARNGDLLVRIVGDVKLLRDVAVTAVLPLLGGAVVLFGMMSVMLWLNWRLALVAIAVLPLFALTTLRTGKRIHEAARKQRKTEGAVAAVAAEAISSIQVVQALSIEARFEAGFTSGDERSVRDEVKTRRLTAQLSRNTDLVIAAATAVVLCYGGRLALLGELTPGELIVFLTYLKRGLRPLENMAKYASRLAKATAAGERIIELLETHSDVTDAPGATAAPPLEGAVSFRGVSFAYDGKAPTLHGFDVDIAAGEFVAIVGASGVGKSTVLNLLHRFYEPTAGVITIDGRNVHDWTIASVRSQIGVVLQDTVLFAADVWENIALGAPGATRQAVERAAKLAEADEFIRSLPEGYDTVLGERGVNLSHGQRQRIAIARTIVRDAPIVLLDEPATALDGRNKRLVRSALRQLGAGRTTIMVTHDLADAQCADRVLVLEGGRVIEEGPPEDLLRRSGRFAELYHQHATPSLPQERLDPATA